MTDRAEVILENMPMVEKVFVGSLSWQAKKRKVCILGMVGNFQIHFQFGVAGRLGSRGSWERI